jgi:hypothetical protein
MMVAREIVGVLVVEFGTTLAVAKKLSEIRALPRLTVQVR